jgi:hypothetical protein
MQLKGVMYRLRPNLSHFLSQLILQDRPITAQKSRSALMLRQALGGSSVISSKQSARMTWDANPSVSPWFEQFHIRETACGHSLNLWKAVNASL